MLGVTVMRIVHYLPQLQAPECGTCNAVRGWCEALVAHGQTVRGICDAAMVTRPPPEGTESIPLPHKWRGRARVPVGIERWIDGNDVIVMHGGWILSNIIVARTAADIGVPTVLMTHGVYAPEVLRKKALTKRLWALGVEKRHLNSLDGIHVFFHDETKGLDELGVHSPVFSVPNGIAKPTGISWDGGSGDYMLWLGRYDPFNKGLDLLLEALAGIPANERPNLRLHGPDSGGNRAEVARLVTQLRLGSSVVVGEPIYGREKWELIARATACVYPSRWDACPVAVMEAAAAGVPTIVAGYALGRFLAERDAAVLVDLSVDALIAGIRRVLSDEGRHLGRHAAHAAEAEFGWAAVTKSWLRSVAELPRMRTASSESA